MSIDDSVGRDPRVTLLASLLKWSRRETVGCLVMDVWPICYDQRTHLVSARIVNAAAGRDDFADMMVDAELAHRDRSGKLAIVGARERIRYLDHQREAGRQGGLKSAEVRARKSKQTPSDRGSNPQALGNPSVPDSASASASAPDPSPSPEHRVSAPPTSPGKSKGKTKAPTYTEAELASVATILERLSERSGVRYRGGEKHTSLIVARLRQGVTEWDMRRVIGYCAVKLGWQDPTHRLHAYMRPETLFGPETIERYLDPARAWEPAESPDEYDGHRDTKTQNVQPRANGGLVEAMGAVLPFPFDRATPASMDDDPAFLEPTWMTTSK